MKMDTATAMVSDVRPRAWVGCLGCYNDGRLTGAWGTADIVENVGGPCVRCGSDEWWCFDVEGVPEVREMSPSEFVTVAGLVEAVADHPHVDALRLWMAYDWRYNVVERNYDPDEIVDAFGEAFDGEWDSYADYAYEWVDNVMGGLDDMLQWLVVDWEATGRDLAHLTLVDGGTLYIFREV